LPWSRKFVVQGERLHYRVMFTHHFCVLNLKPMRVTIRVIVVNIKY
jgi:hypothetical protein